MKETVKIYCAVSLALDTSPIDALFGLAPRAVAIVAVRVSRDVTFADANGNVVLSDDYENEKLF